MHTLGAQTTCAVRENIKETYLIPTFGEKIFFFEFQDTENLIFVCVASFLFWKFSVAVEELCVEQEIGVQGCLGTSGNTWAKHRFQIKLENFHIHVFWISVMLAIPVHIQWSSIDYLRHTIKISCSTDQYHLPSPINRRCKIRKIWNFR